MATSDEIRSAIDSAREILNPFLPSQYFETSPLRFDFSKKNPAIANVDMSDYESLQAYIDAEYKHTGRTWGLGGYMEDRFFYEKSELFRSGNEYRSIHLGLDIWLPAGTPFFAPLPARVHSFQNNAHFLDYGPTIILEHTIGNLTFWTLHGHLSAESLDGLYEGKEIQSGEQFATLGAPPINGSWPPHVHWQIIGNLSGKKGDYPGVATPREAEKYRSTSCDSELLLKPFLEADN